MYRLDKIWYNMSMVIKKNTEYRILGNSAYFKNKYGTSNPVIIIEDEADKVFGMSWGVMQGNPTAMLFAMRTAMEGINALNEKVYYGKINNLAELVVKSELEKVGTVSKKDKIKK